MIDMPLKRVVLPQCPVVVEGGVHLFKKYLFFYKDDFIHATEKTKQLKTESSKALEYQKRNMKTV